MGKIEDDIRGVQADVRSIKETLGWHKGVGWTIAVLFVGVFGWLSTFYIPDKFTDKLPSDFKERFAKLEQNIINVQERLNRLTPSTLNRLIPSPDTKISKKVLAMQLRKASDVIDVALKTQIPAGPQLLAPLQKRVSDLRTKYQSDAEVRSAASSIDVRLIAYEEASKRLLEGLEPISEPNLSPEAISRSSYLMGFTMVCSYPTAHFLGVVPPGTGEHVIVFDVEVDTCAQKLDGPRWINDDFKGSTVEYHGGPLYLADVTFTNCKFEFGTDSNSKMALSIISASNGTPVSLLIR
jgi:hypothetical protein